MQQADPRLQLIVYDLVKASARETLSQCPLRRSWVALHPKHHERDIGQMCCSGRDRAARAYHCLLGTFECLAWLDAHLCAAALSSGGM